MITQTSEWGHRGKIVGDRKFDLSTFSISVELSTLLPQTYRNPESFYFQGRLDKENPEVLAVLNPIAGIGR